MSTGGPRFAELKVEELNAAQRPLADRVMREIKRASLSGPFSIMLRCPGMAAGMIETFEYYRLRTGLDPRLKELAILILAREWTADFEWYAHKPAAERAGLAAATIEELRLGRRPATLKPDEAIVYDFATALVRERGVSDAVFAAARDLLGEERLIDLAALLGEYMKVALLLGLGRVGVPAGQELPPLEGRTR
jgi:4-carboxymuconolactone decarboxylase